MARFFMLADELLLQLRNDSGSFKVVRRKLDSDLVANKQTNPVSSHLSADNRNNGLVHFWQVDAKLRVGQIFNNLPFKDDAVPFAHIAWVIVSPSTVARHAFS